MRKYSPAAFHQGSGLGIGCNTLCCSDCSSNDDEFFLSDASPRDRIWDERKREANLVRDLYRGTKYNTLSDRMDGCSGFLEFDWVVDAQTGEITLKLKSARFCRVRHCPICAWRKSLMWLARLFKAIPPIMADYPSARFILLTLTVRNCPVVELKKTIQHMNKSWQRLSQKKHFPAIGFAKSTEVTREKGTDYAHPHFHCILMVTPNYFSRNYLSQADWTEMWKDALRVDYTPIVDVRTVRPKKVPGAFTEGIDIQRAALMSSIVETFKYSVKPEDLLGVGESQESNRKWLIDITTQLHKTRAVSLGGVFKNYLSEAEPEDLIHTDLEDEEISGEISQIWFGYREMVQRYAKHG